MTERDAKTLDTLRHMLGINDPVRDSLEPWRNYGAFNHDDPHLVAMASAGLVERYRRCEHYDWWQCTLEGITAAKASARRRQLPARKRRYLRFLSVRECVPDLTFREFLTAPEYEGARRGGIDA